MSQPNGEQAAVVESDGYEEEAASRVFRGTWLTAWRDQGGVEETTLIDVDNMGVRLWRAVLEHVNFMRKDMVAENGSLQNDIKGSDRRLSLRDEASEPKSERLGRQHAEDGREASRVGKGETEEHLPVK